MSSFLLTAFVLSLDSFIVAVALSPLIRSPASRWRLATLFGICDGLAVLVGSGLNSSALSFHVPERVVAFFIIVFGVYFLVAAQWNQFRVRPRLVYILPVLMSVDNLAYGAGLGQVTGAVLAQALGLGAASLALAALGLYLGSFVRFASARTCQVAAGFALLTAGLVLSLI
jgi:manganese efflux pump family protein